MYAKLTVIVSAISVVVLWNGTSAESSYRRFPGSRSPPVLTSAFSTLPNSPVQPVVTRWQQMSRNSDEVIYSIGKEFSSPMETVESSTTAAEPQYLATTTELPSQPLYTQRGAFVLVNETDVTTEDRMISLGAPLMGVSQNNKMITDGSLLTSPEHGLRFQQRPVAVTSKPQVNMSPISIDNEPVTQTPGTESQAVDIPLTSSDVDFSTEYAESLPDIDVEEHVRDQEAVGTSQNDAEKKVPDRVGISVDVYYTGSGNSDDSYLIDVERHGAVEVNSSSTKFDQYTIVKRPYPSADWRGIVGNHAKQEETGDNLTRLRSTDDREHHRLGDEVRNHLSTATHTTLTTPNSSDDGIADSGLQPTLATPTDVNNDTEIVDMTDSSFTTIGISAVTPATFENLVTVTSSQLDDEADVDASFVVGASPKSTGENLNRVSFIRDYHISRPFPPASRNLEGSLPVHEQLPNRPFHSHSTPRQRFHATRPQQLYTPPAYNTFVGIGGSRHSLPPWRTSFNTRPSPWSGVPPRRSRLTGFQPSGLAPERAPSWPVKRGGLTTMAGNVEPPEDDYGFGQLTVRSRTVDDVGKRSNQIDVATARPTTTKITVGSRDSVHQSSFASKIVDHVENGDAFDQTINRQPHPSDTDTVAEMQLNNITSLRSNVSDSWVESHTDSMFYNSSTDNSTSKTLASSQTWLTKLFDFIPNVLTSTDVAERTSNVSKTNRTRNKSTANTTLGEHRITFPDNHYILHQTEIINDSGRSVLPALVGVLEALTRKQFSWVDLMLAISCTVAVLLACINLAMFIVHVTRGKRGKLTFPHAATTSMATPPVPPPLPPPPPPPSSSKDTRSNTSHGSSSGYADHMSSASSQLGSSSLGSNPSTPPIVHPPVPNIIPLPQSVVGSRSSFSPSTTEADDRKRMFGNSDRKETDFDETLRIRSLTFKRPLTDWGFTSGLGVAMTTPDDREPTAVMTKDSIRSKKVRDVSLKSTGSDQSSGVESGVMMSGVGDFGRSENHFDEHLHHQHYETAKVNIAATIRSGSQSGLQHCQPPHQQMVGPTTAAVPRYRASGAAVGTLFNNYVYSGIGGLVIDVDDKDIDGSINTDFVYGKTYDQSSRHVELDHNRQININKTDNKDIDLSKKRRDRKSSRVGHVKKRSAKNEVPSVNGGHHFYRPWKKLFSGVSKAAIKNGKEDQFVKQIL